MKVYKLFWDEFASWYLEIIKPQYQKPVDINTFNATISIFERLMLVIHPFMPFITEEIWQLLRERKEGESIMVSRMPVHKRQHGRVSGKFEIVKEIISNIRTIRRENNIPAGEKLDLYIRSDENYDSYFLPVVRKMGNLNEIKFTGGKIPGAIAFIVRTVEYYIPAGSTQDKEEELKKAREELEYTRGFLTMVMKKLDNEKFVKNAPRHVIELEKKKQADAISKIEALEERIKALEEK